MKKKFFYFIGIFAVVVVAILNIQLGLNENNVVQIFKLNNVEALSACEVTSNPDNNTGTCVSNYGSSGDTCVAHTDPDRPRCSGNT